MTTRAGESKSPLFLEMFACQQCVDLFFPNKTPKLSRPVIFCINTALFPNSYSFPVTFKGTFLFILTSCDKRANSSRDPSSPCVSCPQGDRGGTQGQLYLQ